MNKNSLLKRIVSSILVLVMVFGFFGAFTALNGAFSGAKAETVNSDGSITYSASDSSIVLNKDAWLEPDGTYAIDLTAYVTGEKQFNTEQFDAPTDFIVVVDQSCTMRDTYSTGCINGYSYSASTYTLTAAKSITRALVDALRANGGDHRVGIIGFGGYSCNSTNSNTGLFDNNGNWYNYRFSYGYQWPVSAQSKYGSTLTKVNTTAGYNALKTAIGKFTYNSGAYTDIGLEMAKGVINATANDTYQVVNENGTVSNVARKKVVIILTDGTPGWDGFDMKIAAAAVNNATYIKHNQGATIYTVAFNTRIEELFNAWNNYGRSDFATSYGWNNDSAPVHTNAYDPAYGTANGVFTTTKYNTLKLQGEFFSRDFTTILSSVYPCTESHGANGPVEGQYITNAQAYSYVGQYSSNIQSTNNFPAYNINGYYANAYVARSKSIAYFYTEANGSHKLISGLYDNNVRSFNNRIPYNNHPVDKANDPVYGRYRISVPDARVLVNGSPTGSTYSPTEALRQLVSNFVAEIPTATNYSDIGEMSTIGDAYIKDIISEYFFYHNSFDPAVNVKTFTQDVIGYQNGEYVFANNLVSYNNAIVNQYDDVVTVAGFDYDANTCYRDASGVHGKKFIVQIRGLLAKDTTVGSVRISNTPEMISGIYAGTPANNGSNGGDNGGNNGPVVVSNFAPITNVDLQNIYVIYDGQYYYPKQPVLNVTPVNSDYTVTWSVGNTSVASVDENGTVRGKTPNYTTTLTATVYDNVSGRTFTDTSTISVVRPASCNKVTYYEIVPMTLKVGSSKVAAIDVSPINTNYSIKSWTSSNSNVARVESSTGKVVGVSEGTATLTVKVYDWVQGKYLADKSITVTVLPENTVIDNGGDNGGNNGGSNGGNNGPEELLVVGGDEVIFPVPSANIREKSIVYDFSLKIQDDNALTFFETDAITHDVRHLLTIDDAYAQQQKLANGSYNYHGTYPYAGNAKYDAYKDHFEVGISEINENGQHVHTDNNCHAYVVIKSMVGDKHDVATLLELTSTRRDIITGEMKTVYEWCRVYFIPATNVHYEESLFTYTNANGTKSDLGAWTIEGTANGPAYNATTGRMLEGTKYSDAHQSTANDLYGHDAEYHNLFEANKVRDTHGDSNGRAMTVTVNTELRTLVGEKQAQWPTVEFTFRGNAIDLISRAGINTGVFGVDIVPVDKDYSYVGTAADSAHLIVNTYYSEGLSYQSTVMNYSGLNWGEYKVQIRAIYVPTFDMQSNPNYVPTKGDDISLGLEQGVTYQLVNACTNPASSKGEPTKGHGSFDCYIDAVRIYNPLVDHINANDVEKHAYYAADEHNPEYSSIRERLINAASFGGAADRVSGIVYIDTNNGNPVTVSDYDKFGPNHEAYLTPGNGFAFTVTEFNKKTDRLHISAKSPNAKNVIMSVNGVKYTIDSATELFFDITDAITETGRVVITCDDMGGSPDAILSLCQVKLVSNTKVRGDRFFVDGNTIEHAEEVANTDFVALQDSRDVKSAIVDRSLI